MLVAQCTMKNVIWLLLILSKFEVSDRMKIFLKVGVTIGHKGGTIMVDLFMRT